MNQVSSAASYNEWVLPSWPSFLPVLLVYPTLWLTFVPFNEPVGVISGILLTAVVVFLMISKSARISVTEGNLTVRHATIGVRFIRAVSIFDGQEAFAERGRNLDSRAYVHFQGSVKTLVKIDISDPQDPTPYWLFSTRQPEKLRKALGF
jgi:hypothetical protein